LNARLTYAFSYCDCVAAHNQHISSSLFFVSFEAPL
jgi:hypothetical protein